MAQHDYNLSNNTGALYRADNNAALQAIVTQNSGTSAPAVTFPGMLWLDLSGGGDGVMRRRNQGNTAWLNDIGVDQVARDAANAAAATANAAMPKAGGTFTGAINLPGGEPTNNQAVSRAAADALYQVRLPAASAGTLLYGAAAGWTNVLAPAANDTVLVLSGGLPSWHTGAQTAQPNSYVRTKSDGTIDASLIPAVATGLRFRGTFRPAVNAEYPTTGGSGAGGAPAVGDFWVIDGLTTGGFTYLTGSLAGVTVYNGDSIAKSDGAQWYRMGSVIDVEGYLRVDGSSAMEGDLNMGAFSLTEVGGIVARAGTPVPLQNFSIDATNVVVSPQRGTTGPNLPTLATGQLGTDLGRRQIWVGASGTNVPFLSTAFFSETNTYVPGEYVSQGGYLWRARGAVSAGAFTASQWDQVIDAGNATFKAVPVAPGFVVNVPAATEGTFTFQFTDRAVYLFGNEGTKSVGVYDTLTARVRWLVDTNGNTTQFGNASAVGFLTSTGRVESSTSLNLAANGASILLRPNGSGSTVGQLTLDTTGNVDAVGSIRVRGNTHNVQLFDNNGDVPAIDLGAGYGTPTDRHGYIINRNATGFLSIGGRNQNCELVLGAQANVNTLKGDLRCSHQVRSASALVFTDRTTPTQERHWYADVNLAYLYFSETVRNAIVCDPAGNVTATSFNPTCDERIKEGIALVAPRALDALGLYTFTFTDSGQHGRGPIAQRVEEVAPEYVSELQLPNGPIKTVNLTGLTYEMVLNLASRVAALESTTEH